VPDPCPGTGARLDRSAGHEERERGPLSDTRKKGVQCPGRGNTEIKNHPSSLLYSVKFLAASMEFRVVMVAIGIKFAMPGQEIPPKTGTFFR
jgi:hypothetical protein